MRLTGFRYLSRRRTVLFFLTLVLASMLFSITALSFLGYYSSLDSYLGEGENIIAIYDKGSRTPFSGLVPTYLAEHIKSLNGVLASSPEIIIPSIVKDQPVFVRGIIPEEFAQISTYSLREGGEISINDVNQAMIGKELSEKLNVEVGDKILVHSVLVEQYLVLNVKGIFESHSAIDDEILIPLCCGQWLRGTDQDHVTLIRIKIDKNKVDKIAIFKEIAEEATEAIGNQNGEATSDIIPNRRVSFVLEKIGLDEAQKFMKSYLDKYGMTKENLIILSVTTLIFASATIIMASKTIIQQHECEMEVLKSIGASDRAIKIDLLVKLMPWSLGASTLGIMMATLTLQIFQRNGQLQAFSHRIPVQPDIPTITLNFVLIAVLTAMAIIHLNVEITRNY